MKRLMFLVVSILIALPLWSQITLEKQSEGVLVSEEGRKVLFYQTENQDIDGKYQRTNYIHPLWTVDGTVITEDFPSDHLHQRGVFWAWHQILINGKRIGDGWALEDFDQKVTEIDCQHKKNGKGIIKSRVLWSSVLWKDSKPNLPYIEETTFITVHPAKSKSQRIDFEIQLKALTDNVFIGGSEDDKGYSGFSIRMKLPEDVQFFGTNGRVEPQNTQVSAPGYINISGTFDGVHPGGVIITDHKKNPGYPQGWILRTRRSMQNAAYPGKDVVGVPTSKPLILKYSLIVYDGKPDAKEVYKMVRK